MIDGVMRKGIAEACKTGWIYILDRTNGKPLIGIDEKPVEQEPRNATAATQPSAIAIAAGVPPAARISDNASRIAVPAVMTSSTTRTRRPASGAAGITG